MESVVIRVHGFRDVFDIQFRNSKDVTLESLAKRTHEAQKEGRKDKTDKFGLMPEDYYFVDDQEKVIDEKYCLSGKKISLRTSKY